MHIAAIGGGNKEPILTPIIETLDSCNAVIIPTACSTEKSYAKKVPITQKWCGELGLRATVLHAFGEIPSEDKVAELFGQASFAYVIGGNTPYMLDQLPRHKTNTAITGAVHRGMWLTGTSAGALLPFAAGLSCPAKRPAEENWDYTYVSGLGLLPAAGSAHANKVDPHPSRPDQLTRLAHFAETLPQGQSIGFAIENNAALVIDGTKTYVGRANPDARLHLVTHGEPVQDVRDNDYLTEVVASLYKK